MFRNKMKLINDTGRPVLATLVAAFMELSETNIREVAKKKNRSYKSLTSACRQGLAWKHLAPAFDKALDDAIYEAAAADTTDCSNKLREESTKQYLKTLYLSMT